MPIIQDAAAQSAWREDLQLLATQLPQIHADLFFEMTEDEFETAVNRLDEQIPFLTDNQILVELMKIVAMISKNGRDGHSILFPIEFNLYPLHLYWFSDGLFIIDALEPYTDLIGTQVLQIGGVDVEQLFQMFDPLLPRDNDMTIRGFIPSILLAAELYNGLQIIEDINHTDFTIRAAGGEPEFVTLRPIPLAEYEAWKEFPTTLPPQEAPLYLTNLEEDYWFTFLAESQTLYIQYNGVTSQTESGTTMIQFSQQIDTFLAENEVSRVVVDVRLNRGGDNTTYGPFLDLFRQHEMFQEPGNLFVITSRHTFSAAGNFVTEMERFTTALFVGEPAGGGLNQYGDTQTLILPNSQIVVLISTIYHQKGAPGDERLLIPPDIPTDFTSDDYFNGHDPALEAILNS